MRKRITVLVGALAALALLAPVAQGHHRNPQLTITPNPVDVGNLVTLSATDSDTNGDVTIAECRVSGEPAPAAACAVGEPGAWVIRAVKNKTDTTGVVAGDGPVTYQFTPTAAGIYGFRAYSSAGHNEDWQDLTVNALNSGDRHQGCNGIENAITKVKEGGNAKLKLDAIAAKFHCDV